MALPQYRYEMPYRSCWKAFGLTYPIAICLECKQVVEPTREEYSKTGAHGTWYYVHKHKLAFIVLKRSNSGKRDVAAVGDVPAELVEEVRTLWEWEGACIGDIEDVIERFLAALKLKEAGAGGKR